MKNSTAPVKTTAKRIRPAKPINDTSLPPLQPHEYDELVLKVERLNSLNTDIVDMSAAVDDSRAELLEAKAALELAEADLRAVRENHQNAMREVAPLLNRLPTV